VRPARAVRPHRCENVLVSVGESNWTTASTWGRSRPRAATSVANKIEGFEDDAIEEANASRVRVRADGGRLPWRE